MDSPSMSAMAAAIEAAGLRVARFEFGYMAARRTSEGKKPPPRAETLMAEYREAVAELGSGTPLVIGGKSMGGRVASMVADELFAAGRIVGLVCLGYPFHPPGQPEKLRTAHLRELRTRALIVQGTRDAFGLLKASGAGSLINVSSIMGHRGLRQLAAYSATKGAVTALTKALAVEYAQYGIRVNTLAPGYIDTALTERFIKNPLVAKALLDKTPMRRFGTPEEIARAALFFASDDSLYVTGAELAVDGGMSAGL